MKQDKEIIYILVGLLPRWWHKRNQRLFLHKDQWLGSYPLIKTALGELWSLLKKLQPSETKSLKMTVQKKKWENFICLHCFIVQAAIFSARSDLPS